MPLHVNASDGYWIRNGQLYLAPDPADPLMDGIGVSRASGNVLLWTKAGIIYRFETALDRVPAVAVVEALVPIATPSANEHDDITVGFGAAASVSRRSPLGAEVRPKEEGIVGCLPLFLRRIVQGWIIAKVVAWIRRRSAGGGPGAPR